MRAWWMTGMLLVALSGARAADGTAPSVEDAVATIRPITVMVEADLRYGHRSYGSGFLVSSDGLVATCGHVVRRAQEIFCYYRNGERIRAKKVIDDEDLDLAVLKLQGDKTYPTAVLGDSDLDAVEGSAVGLCGYPLPSTFFRIGVGLDSTSAAGTIGALRLGDRAENRSRNAVLQLDVQGHPGNSGGPVFRLEDSKVIGVFALRMESNPPIAFAIPINQLKTSLASHAMGLVPAPLKPDSPEATVEPGMAETLVPVRDDHEMADSFLQQTDYRGTRAEQGGIRYEMIPAFGFNPAAHPRPTVEAADLYIGGLNGYMHKVRHRRLTTEEEWNIELDYPITMPAALDKENVTVAGGTLKLSYEYGSFSGGEQVGVSVASALTLGLSGLFKWKKRISRVLETEGKAYVLDKDDGRLKAQIDTAFPNAPAVREGVAYIPALGQLMALDVNSGTAKWKIGDPQRDLEGRTWYTAALGSDGKLYTFEMPVRLNVRMLPGGGTHFYMETGVGKSHDDTSGRGRCLLRCRNPEDGKVEWETPLYDATTYLRPLATALTVSDDAKMAYCQLGPLVVAVDLATKKMVWPAEPAMKKQVAEMVKVCWDRQREIEKQKGDVAMSHREAGLTSATSHGMTLANGRLYYGCYDIPTEGTDKAYVRVIKADTGEEVKRLDCPGRPTAPLVADGVVYFGSSHTRPMPGGRGEPESWLFAFNESTLEEAWRLRVANMGFSYAPQAVSRTLYFADAYYLYELPLPLR